MSEPAVLFEQEGYIATITLNRPENRNSMTPDVLDGFLDAVESVRNADDVRCVVITGKGKSFCAGADFKSGVPGGAGTLPPNERSLEAYRPFLSVLEIEVPVIGALNGHAIGGGLGLALVCDMRVANAEAKYGANFTKLGLHPGMATTYLLPRMVGVPRAAELLFTGRIITGQEAAEIGLVNYATPLEEVLPKALELAGEVAGCAPIATRWTKRSLYEHSHWEPGAAARHEAELQSRTIDTADYQEGVAALLEKRAPQFKSQ